MRRVSCIAHSIGLIPAFALFLTVIRVALFDDIPALLALENSSFEGDRLSRRSFRYLLSKGQALALADEQDGRLRGYIMLLFRRKESLARVYSIATHSDFKGQGVAAGLLLAAEQSALAHNSVAVRLEIRKDNHASLHLFQSRGYRIFGEYEDYYDDGMDAFRLQKSLTQYLRPEIAPVTTASTSPS
jgi:ribosomal protein S18 acetylase RimI-like enzyme